MKIRISDKEAVATAIAEVEGKATQRLVTADEAANFAARAEARLEQLGLPKCRRVGAVAILRHGGLPRAYKYRAESTEIVMQRYRDDWRLTAVYRGSIGPGQASVSKVTLTKEQGEWMASNPHHI